MDARSSGQTSIQISLNLNLSVETFEIREECLIAGDSCIPLGELQSIVSAGNKVFGFDKNGLVPIEVRAAGYYKLVPTSSVPTLEINGIKMHRSKDIDPLEDALLKTQLVVRPGNTVLDTCGGLGYSALFAVKAGARKVVSTEKSPEVLKIRNQNPWVWPGAFDWFSSEASQRIQLEQGDINELITSLPDDSFDAVVHDPPRFCSATGDLYGKVFYEQLARVMRTGALLFHYTGSPKKIVHQDRFIQNAMKRLDLAGFYKISFNEHLQGIYAEKNKRIVP